MSRLIDADSFKYNNQRMLDCDFPYICEATLEELIDSEPTVDAKPVVHGKWLPIYEANEFGDVYQSGIYCSECGEQLVYEANYCPNCGARMK